MNSVNLVGRITKDLELKTTSVASKPYVLFTLAVDDFFNNEKITQFISCSAWNKQAENIVKFFKKGSQIAIEGSLNVRSDNKNGQFSTITSVNVNKFTFIGSSNSGTQFQQNNNQQTTTLNNNGYDLVKEKEESPKTNNDSILWED